MNSYSSNRNRKDHTRRDSSVGAKRRSGGQRLLYDAHGVRIKQSRFPQKLKRALLFYILPYLVINGLIFFVVTATPDINLNVAETDDYQNTQVEFEVKSILPISEMKVQMESVDVPYTETSRHHYISDISHNGMFYVTVKSWNGMQTTNYVNVSVLDDTAPSIDEETCNIANGYLTFVIEDSQSGVDYDSIYGVYDGGKEVRPTRIDTNTGTVSIPMYSNSIELHFEDMVGNARMGTITASNDYAEEETGETVATAEADSDEADPEEGTESAEDEAEAEEA